MLRYAALIGLLTLPVTIFLAILFFYVPAILIAFISFIYGYTRGEFSLFAAIIIGLPLLVTLIPLALIFNAVDPLSSNIDIILVPLLASITSIISAKIFSFLGRKLKLKRLGERDNETKPI